MLKPAFYRAAYLGLMFVVNLLLANLLEPSGLGKLSLMVLNASLASLISGIGSDAITMHALVQQKWTFNHGFNFLAKMTILQIVGFATLQGMSLLLVHKTLLSAGGSEMFWIEFVYFSGLLLTEKCLTLYYVLHRATLYNLLLFGIGGIYILLLTIFWIEIISLSALDIFCLVAFHSLVQGSVLVYIFFIFQTTIKYTPVNWQKTLRILRHSALIMLTNVVQLLAYRIDYWLLDYYHTSSEVGLYAQANKFAGLLWIFPNIMAALLIPKFSNMQQNEILVVFRFANIINLLMAVITTLATTIIYRFFLLPEYGAGMQAFWVMMPGFFCWALVIYFGAYFSWKGAFKTNFLASSICLVIILLADLFLIPKFSYNGAALANTIAYGTVLLLYLYFLKRINGNLHALFFKREKNDLGLLKNLFK